MTAHTTASSPARDASMKFPPALRRVIVVTTLGSFMSFLDSTIVNVALRTLALDLHTSLATIQWVVTAYLLAMAAVIPASGWAATRFGSKQMYVLAVALFTAASLACGLATSTGMLIAFRAVQGVAGGLLMPVATMIAMRAAGPKVMPKVMSATLVPTIMGPVIGPTIGGLLLDHASWPWIFYINVPIGILTVGLSLRLLRGDQPSQAGRLDVLGLLLVTAGSVAMSYGLAEIGTEDNVGSATVVLSIIVGVVLLVAFVIQQLHAKNPLMDIRLYRKPLYSAAWLTNFCLGASIFGAIILMPLYFQIVRHENAVSTGLLGIPQGLGVAVAMFFGAKLVEKVGSGRAAFLGGLISIAGALPFAFIKADTSYWFLCVVMVIRGFGVGACVIPILTAAYRAISPTKIPDATVQLNVGQRIGGSAATALFAVVLQNGLNHATGPATQAASFGTAFWWVVAIGIACAAPALLLAAAERRGGAPTGGPSTGEPPTGNANSDAVESATAGTP